MKEYLAALVRKLISPSMRSNLRDGSEWLRELLGKICIWRWEIVRLHQSSENSPYDIIYAGRKTHRELVKILLMQSGDIDAQPEKTAISSRTALVSEAPIPGALRVPNTLRVIIPLGKPIEAITAEFDDKLRRVLRNQRGDYHTQQALDTLEIDRADQELLKPYASARHGTSAAQLTSDRVRKMALKSGRLDLVLLGDEVVGCILGCEITRARKRHWGLVRCGYPEAIFSDSKRLRETNAINFYLALEWAINNGFDYYDMGTCLGRPEDGLLQWKKRWGGLVSATGNHGYFYVRLPKLGKAQFLWDAPLFAVESGNVTLHLGLPDGPSDEQFSLRYREMNRGMGIGGLFKIYLYCARPPGEDLLNALRSHYSHQKSPPIVESITSL